MELTLLQTSLIIGGVILIIIFQAFFAFYLETRVRKDKRIEMHYQLSDEKGIHFIIQGVTYSFPLVDFSKSGISFSMNEFPKDFLLSKSMTIRFENAEFTPIEIDSELIYMRPMEDGKIRIGLKFKKTLTEHIWNGTLNTDTICSDYSQKNAA